MQYATQLSRPLAGSEVSPFGPADVRRVTRRGLAYLVDLAALFVIVVLGRAAGWTQPQTLATGSESAILATYRQMLSAGNLRHYLIAALITFGYFTLMEWLFGSTIGKWVFGIRVVDFSGRRISFGQALFRNLLRLIDGLFAGVVGLWFMFNNERRQRLGDKATGTLVVSR